MDADQFVSTVRDDAETALSRLGSSKSLYAATGGEMDADEVYRAAADAEHAARRTFETWADAEDGDVGALFDGVADTERDHYETVVANLDDHDPGAVPAVHEFLREQADTVARLGGFVGRTLASE